MSSVDLGILKLRRIDKEPEMPDSDDEGFVDEEQEMLDKCIKEVKYQIVQGERVIGVLDMWHIQLLEIWEANESFFMLMDEHSREASDFAATLFDNEGNLKSRFGREGTGVWKRADMEEICSFSYLQNIRVEPDLRNRGIGSWALARLWKEKDEDLSDMRYLYTYPSALHSEFPHVPPFEKDPHEAEKTAMSQRLLGFYRKAGFRRVGTTEYFCCTNVSGHGSHRISADQDAAEYRSPDDPVNPGDARLFEVVAAGTSGRSGE